MNPHSVLIGTEFTFSEILLFPYPCPLHQQIFSHLKLWFDLAGNELSVKF